MAKRWCVFFALVLASVASAETPPSPGPSAASAPVAAGAPASTGSPAAVPSEAPAVQDEELQKLRPYAISAEGKLPEKIRIGDTLFLRVQGLTAGLRVDSPRGDADLVQRGWKLVSSDSSGLIAVVPLQSGNLLLPPLAIRDQAGKAVGATQAASVGVQSALGPGDAQEPDLTKLRPPVRLGFPVWVTVLLSLLALVALGTLVWAVRRWRRRRPKKAKPLGPPKPEHETALEALAEVEKLGLVAKGHHKKHFFRVSEILKAYLGSRYGIDALESTSDELVSLLEEGKFVSPSVVDRIESLFVRLDQVKFTDHVPSVEDGRLAIEDARAFVGMTKRIPVAQSVSVTGGQGAL